MPQMIVAHHREAPVRQVLGKGLVTQNLLRHTVGNLHDGPDIVLWQPRYCVDGCVSVGGGKNKFISEHGKTGLLMLYWAHDTTAL